MFVDRFSIKKLKHRYFITAYYYNVVNYFKDIYLRVIFFKENLNNIH